MTGSSQTPAARYFTSILNLSKSPPPIVTATNPSGSGHIRSFVHRRAHITPSQEQAIAQWLPRWSIPYQHTLLDPARAFGREAPVILEIGFGMGETTQQIAQARPDENFLGVEVFNAGVGALLKRIEENGLGNIRIIQHDAVEVLRDMIAPGSLAGVHIYFPDPWPKKRHHKRRLIQPPFVALLAERLAPGAYIHCATDWEHYAHQMLEVLSAEGALKNTCADFAPRPDYRPLTKFESRGLRLGHGVWDLVFTRREDAAPPNRSNKET
ncbi:tRNA (guanosine(46)-N7)-methyltransferase TrmB [Castellaniella sp. GW247-6E4]|uniref:tRNA (guanosine(46)-N7)-methyltransferase TrmB n=1 Tax=Castellaniella sp. GW247-6E4 TaxID=3140380 RepID=UPI003315D41E